MKLSKLLVSCVAAGALAAACTTAAFAADGVTAEYKDGKVTVSAFGDYAAKVKGDFTLLVLSEDTTVTSDNANSIIKQIDQFGITGDAYTKEVTVGDLANGTYYVRLGGAEADAVNVNGFVATSFTVGSTEPAKVLVGDADGDKEITLNDCSEICKYINGKLGDIRTEAATDNAPETVDTNKFLAAAFSDGDKEITLNDCSEICKQINGKTVDHVGNLENINQYD